MNNTYLIFTIGVNQYAINTSFIQSIIEKVHITKIPLLPKYILGSISYDDKPISLVDINIIYNNKETKILNKTCFIVLSNKFSIVSDTVDEIIDIEEKEIRPMSDFIFKEIDSNMFTGIYNKILIIDINQLN